MTLPIEFRLSGHRPGRSCPRLGLAHLRVASGDQPASAGRGARHPDAGDLRRGPDVRPDSRILAFGLLFALTAFTCLLSPYCRTRSARESFGIVGFAAPILTSTGHGNHIGLFVHYALLNAGILAIALKRSWRLLNLLGFAFTFVIATVWRLPALREAQDYASVQGFLILFLLFYVAISVFTRCARRRGSRTYVDGTPVFGTPLVAFGPQYGIVRDKPFGSRFSALAPWTVLHHADVRPLEAARRLR